MLALLAAITFLLGVVFQLATVDTGKWSLLLIGLTLLALHFVWPVVVIRRRVPPQ